MTDIFKKFSDGSVTAERVDEHMALVTLNRPDARNAVNGKVTRGLDEIVRATDANPAIWAVVLKGAGARVFSAGADLKEVAEDKVASLYTDAGGFAGLAQAERKKVWIAAVDGFALAGRFVLVLSCDMVVASEGTQFGLVNNLALSGGAVQESLAIARKSPDLDDKSLDRLSMEAQDRLQKMEDFKEGPRAFIEKRARVWKGR